MNPLVGDTEGMQIVCNKLHRRKEIAKWFDQINSGEGIAPGIYQGRSPEARTGQLPTYGTLILVKKIHTGLVEAQWYADDGPRQVQLLSRNVLIPRFNKTIAQLEAEMIDATRTDAIIKLKETQ